MAFSFDITKAQNIVLFIVHSMGGKADMARLFLHCYFADRLHLARHGVLILGDTYLAMIYGPVPFQMHGVFKQLPTTVGDTIDLKGKSKPKFVLDQSMRLVALSPYNANWLSKTEVQCIFETLQEYKDKTFDELSELARSTAWKNANHGEVNIIDIAIEGGARPDMIRYIRNAWADELLLSASNI